jgi:hypothetical protein
MKIVKDYKTFIFESSKLSPIDILTQLTLSLSDDGLHVVVTNDDNRFNNHGELFVLIEDKNKIFCKNYPEDDMDWLVSKPIILDFFKELELYNLKRDVDYRVYGGGTGVNLIFSKDSVKKLNFG